MNTLEYGKAFHPPLDLAQDIATKWDMRSASTATSQCHWAELSARPAKLIGSVLKLFVQAVVRD